MRFLQPEPRTAPKDIFSKSWTVSIERYLRIVAEYILIATNNAHSNQFDLACAIYYPKAINKKLLQKHLCVRRTVRHMLPCIGEAQDLGNRIVHVWIPKTKRPVVEFAMDVGLWWPGRCCETRCSRSALLTPWLSLSARVLNSLLRRLKYIPDGRIPADQQFPSRYW